MISNIKSKYKINKVLGTCITKLKEKNKDIKMNTLYIHVHIMKFPLFLSKFNDGYTKQLKHECL